LAACAAPATSDTAADPAGTARSASTARANAPLEAALQRALEHPGAAPGRPLAHEAALLRETYAGRAAPLWLVGGRLSPQGTALIAEIDGAATQGHDPRDLGAPRIDAARAALAGTPAATPATLAAVDLALTRGALRLVSELHYGRVDPRAAGFEMPRRQHRLDVAATVAALANAGNVAAAIAAVEPPFYHYRLLVRALAKYRALAAIADLTHLPRLPKRALRAGDEYAGAAALRRRLLAVGDLAEGAATPPGEADRIGPTLVAALERFQQRHGLTPDGVLGPHTAAALTTPIAHRVRQIELTLERFRWLPPFTAPPIIVNIPQFRLFALANASDRTAGMLQMAVIVGQAYPKKRTPVFTGELKEVVFRPYWNVPRDIVVHEILPAIARHPHYLARNHFELVRGPSDDSPVVAPTRAALAALAAGRLRLRQRPGDDNALGLVKFIFPNAHDVFMHGTPAQALFAQSRRAFSHGCIRVADPVALARYVLRRGPGTWDDARILAAMHGADNVHLTLPQPIPVMILYGTALATEAGPIDFFDDLYGQDRKLAALLERGVTAPHTPVQR
ncbi:MAG: L,D-transpeptidase family protein, partial [Gammaproteobacteria bacterium]|nr:L,D-transpeptidase family protein [Gammaproteobacteria bacterium]